MTAGQLVEMTGLTGASVTALVDRLEASGYVTRERDAADRRAISVRANLSKVRTLDDLYLPMSVEMSKLLSTYGEVEFAAITDYLTRASELLASETTKVRATPPKDGTDSNNGRRKSKAK
jgi:DNA-binding MarR family transcriptional regulator